MVGSRIDQKSTHSFGQLLEETGLSHEISGNNCPFRS